MNILIATHKRYATTRRLAIELKSFILEDIVKIANYIDETKKVSLSAMDDIIVPLYDKDTEVSRLFIRHKQQKYKGRSMTITKLRGDESVSFFCTK